MKMTFIESLCPECAAQAAWLRVLASQREPEAYARVKAHWRAMQDLGKNVNGQRGTERIDKMEEIIGIHVGLCYGTLTTDDYRLVPKLILEDYAKVAALLNTL